MPRVLLVLTSHGELGDTGEKTGYNVAEAAHPWQVFRAAGFDVDFSSIAGGLPPADTVDAGDPVQVEFSRDRQVQEDLAASLRPEQVNPDDYDAIYLVGGHGAMWDFPDSEALAVLARSIYENGGVVAAVCHGPAGLVNLSLSNDTYLVTGRSVAAFTNAEERAVGRDKVVPFLLADRLGERGAIHRPAENWARQVVVDGRLVTGQNPASAAGVAEETVRLLAGLEHLRA